MLNIYYLLDIFSNIVYLAFGQRAQNSHREEVIRWLQIHQVVMGTAMEQFDKGHRSKIRSIIIGPNETPRQEGSSTRKKMGLRSKVSEKRSNFKAKGE
jgi:hypothetical protein